MTQQGFNPGLRRKLAGRGATGAPARAHPDGVEAALTRALGKAAAPYDGLAAKVSPAPPDWDRALTDLLPDLPDEGLFVLLEAAEGRRALCVLEPPVIDALIEVQTTGKVDTGPVLARKPTDVDAALTRDFIGLFLGAFAGAMADHPVVSWPLDLTYGTRLADPRQLELLLPDGACHLFTASLDLGEGAKTGRLLLLVPALDAVALPTPPAEAGEDAGWRRAWQAAMQDSGVALEAVLLRKTLSLPRLEALAVGDVIGFDRADLRGLELCDAKGRVVYKGRLGRKGGHRAVCLEAGLDLRPAAVSDPAPDPASKPVPDAALPQPPPETAPAPPPA